MATVLGSYTEAVRRTRKALTRVPISAVSDRITGSEIKVNQLDDEFLLLGIKLYEGKETRSLERNSNAGDSTGDSTGDGTCRVNAVQSAAVARACPARIVVGSHS